MTTELCYTKSIHVSFMLVAERKSAIYLGYGLYLESYDSNVDNGSKMIEDVVVMGIEKLFERSIY